MEDYHHHYSTMPTLDYYENYVYYYSFFLWVGFIKLPSPCYYCF
jgi:hypothetical protein